MDRKVWGGREGEAREVEGGWERARGGCRVTVRQRDRGGLS